MSKKIPSIFVVVFLAALAAGFIGGFVVGRRGTPAEMVVPGTMQPESTKNILPISVAESPVVEEIQVVLVGTITEISGNAITIERESARLSVRATEDVGVVFMPSARSAELTDIRSGDFVTVEAVVEGDTLIAKSIFVNRPAAATP